MLQSCQLVTLRNGTETRGLVQNLGAACCGICRTLIIGKQVTFVRCTLNIHARLTVSCKSPEHLPSYLVGQEVPLLKEIKIRKGEKISYNQQQKKKVWMYYWHIIHKTLNRLHWEGQGDKAEKDTKDTKQGDPNISSLCCFTAIQDESSSAAFWANIEHLLNCFVFHMPPVILYITCSWFLFYQFLLLQESLHCAFLHFTEKNLHCIFFWSTNRQHHSQMCLGTSLKIALLPPPHICFLCKWHSISAVRECNIQEKKRSNSLLALQIAYTRKAGCLEAHPNDIPLNYLLVEILI